MAKSAINEARDSLFLDTAEGARLDVVTSNMGLHRPTFGFNDDHWRAVGRVLALRPKNIKLVFSKILEVCVGPQFDKIANISVASVAGDDVLFVEDVENLIQIGDAVIDPGLPTEEEVEIVFKDRTTNTIILKNPTTLAHSTLASAKNYLKSNVSIGGTSLVMHDTSTFPTAYPYAVILDQGTENEEIVSISNNNTGTNTLTCSATGKAHSGPKSKYVQKPLLNAAQAGRDFIQFNTSQTRNFPEVGWVRLNKGGGNEETKEFILNNIDDNSLTLKTVLASTHSAGESVDLVSPGCPVSTVSIVQTGRYWDIYETEPRKVYVYIPKNTELLRIIDASYLHNATVGASSTTLAANTLVTDTTLTLTSVAGLPDEAGILLINGVQKVFYNTRNELTNQVTLSQAVGNVYVIGNTVDLVLVNYAATDLDEGNPRDVNGDLIEDRFPGPYVYELGERGPSVVSSTLTTLIPPSTNVVYPQVLGRTNIEVDDLSLWPAGPYNILIGQGTGFEETRTLIDITLKNSAATTVTVNPNSTTLTVANSSAFPEGDGTNPDGYRIIIDQGGPNEETVEVFENDAGTNTFTTVTPMTIVHGAAESVEILNDIITTDALTCNHPGFQVNPTQEGHSIKPYISQLTLATAAGFSTSGYAVVNFGNNRIKAASKFVSGVGVSLVLESTDLFPTTGYPYQITVGEGTFGEEKVFITNNNTGTDTLTMSAALVNTHVVKENVIFTPGQPEVIEYNSKVGSNLVFTTPKILESYHGLNELVMWSNSESNPKTSGFSYALKMPPDLGSCAKVLIELARAAGVEVEFIDNR